MSKILTSILSLEFLAKTLFIYVFALRERFVNPQLLKQLAVYKIKEEIKLINQCFTWNIRKYIEAEFLGRVVVTKNVSCETFICN